MSPRETTTSTKRHPSSLRPRARTAVQVPFPKDYTFDQWQVGACQDHNASVVEEMEPFPHAAPRRLDGLVALGRRLSVTIRNKSSKHNLQVQGEEAKEEDNEYRHYQIAGHSHKRNAASGNWEVRPQPWTHGYSQVNRRPSLNSVSALHSFYAPTAAIPAPIPGHGLEPPILPNDRFSGAAARAAAAAQNEQMEIARLELAQAERRKMLDTIVTQDSESGIEIDLRDHTDSDTELDIMRLDPASYLPAELMTHILCHLDPASLLNSELVSRLWNQQASSPFVWKPVFRGAYPRRPASTTATKKKQLSRVGQTDAPPRLEENHRWKEGKAAAIYLHGHQDSVYCAQFDEDKIITGSRDRTIRVWDAHYPWSCLKVIGPPLDNVPGIGQVNNPAQQATGKSPFLTICPPSTPLENIASPVTQSLDYHSASILCLRFDEEIMVTGSSDFTCIVWDIKNDYKPIRRLSGHRAGVLDVCFDDRYIVSCSKDSTICVWSRKTGELLKSLVGHRGPVNAVQLRGDLVVSASGDGVAKLWNVTSGHCVKEFPSKDRGLACVEFSDDGRTILTGGNDKTIYQFDANTGELVNELHGHTGLIRSLHLDSMNKRIVSGSYDMSVKVFDADSGKLSIDLPGWTTSWMLNVQSDYRRIVATSQDSRAVIMDFGYGLDGIELLEE
ncbi:hypothetical protein N7454_000093 [Penicillium verhagenii]|nr:hypothetical protein N7454_000093 [Penicillium verhagenii]